MSFSYLQVVAATTNTLPASTTPSSSSGRTVFVNSDQQPRSQSETYNDASTPHSQHIQAPRYTEEELDFHQTSKAVFLTNLPRHLDREAIFKILSQITQREVKKFDLPSQQKIRDEYNKGFAYLHLKTPYRTRQLLNKKFLRIGGNKVLIHPYRDHRGPIVLPKKVDLSNQANRHEEKRDFRSRYNTADSGIKLNPGTPVPNSPRPDEHPAVFSPPNEQATPTPKQFAEPCPSCGIQGGCEETVNTSAKCTPTPAIVDGVEEMRQHFVSLTPLQRCMYYTQYSQDRHNTHDFQLRVEKYLRSFAKIANDQYRWARYLQRFAETNGMEFSYVTDTLMEHKQQSNTTYQT